MDVSIGKIYRVKTWEEVSKDFDHRTWRWGFFNKYGGMKVKVIEYYGMSSKIHGSYRYKCKILDGSYKDSTGVFTDVNLIPSSTIELPDNLFEMD